MVKKPKKSLANSSQKQAAASDPPPLPPKEEEPPVDQVADELGDDYAVMDPDPIRWALPADGRPVGRRTQRNAYTEEQMVHMYHLGHQVNWSLKEYQYTDRKGVSDICAKIGINRDKFRSFVHNRKNKKRILNGEAGPSGTGSVAGSGGSLSNEGGPSATV